MLSDVISTHHRCAFMTFFLHFYLLIVSQIIKERTYQDIRISQLSANTSHINIRFGSHNVGEMMGMSGVQYSASYERNCFGARSTHFLSVDNDTAFSLSFAHTSLNYSSEQKNDRTTNGSTCK